MTVVGWFGRGSGRRSETQLSWDPFARDVLFYAAADGDARVVRARIRAGADVNQVERRMGLTPLFFAVEGGVLRTATLLLEAGADLEARSEPRQMTPLIYAVLRWKASPQGRMLKLLLDWGADRAAQEKNGLTPRDVAAGLMDFPESLVPLLEAGGGAV